MTTDTLTADILATDTLATDTLAAEHPEAPPSTAARPQRSYRPEFSGTAREYFGIWIVNVALSIVTLGIYSPWAKVRTTQYFYGSTRIDGKSFEYTADPVAILKGRALVVVALLLYQLSWYVAPLLGVLLALVLVPLLPWIVVRAQAFRARNSTYQNLRFDFRAGYWEAFKYYVLWTLLSVVTFGLAYPYADYLRKRFAARGHRYGATPFDFEGEAGFFYVVHITTWVAAGFVAMLVTVVSGVVGAVVFADATTADGQPEPVLFAGLIAILVAVFAALSVAATACVKTLLANHVWQHARLGDVRFDMRLHPGRVIWIQVSNLALIVFSVGLMIPYARVRMARYRASCFAVLSDVPLDQFVAGNAERVGAMGDEFGEALELDLVL